MKEGLHLFNTMERKVVPLIIQKNKPVRIYACGPTVYNFAHIGNLRTYINEDLLIRVLKFNELKIKHVINITDVGHLTDDEDSGDDKIELSALKEGVSIWEIAERYTGAFMKDFTSLNNTLPTLWSKATDHIQEQIELIQRLEIEGLTYKIENDGIYYDTSKFENYGKLGGQNLEELKAGARVILAENKKNISDFALWKFSQGKKRLMEWPSPWGTGFPGWHIECSAMALKYLGDEIDIHCGGIDHVKVHHCNEIAQVEPLIKKSWVHHWMHSEFLNDQSGKMSKSSGEFLTLTLLETKGYLPLAYRFYCLSSHYRSKLNFSYEALDSAQQGYLGLLAKIRKLKFNSAGMEIEKDKLRSIHEKIKKIINNDLNSPETLAYLFLLLKDKTINAATIISSLDFFDAVLGLNLLTDLEIVENKLDEVPEEIHLLISERVKAKSEKNFSRADDIRKKIEQLGFSIEDGKDRVKIRKN